MKYQNLGEFFKKNSQKHKHSTAYQIKRGLRTERVTFSESYSYVLKTVSFLQNLGLKKGDKVAIWATNMPEYAILYFACWSLGIVVVPIDVRTTQETLNIFLKKAKCQIGFKGKFIPGNLGNLVKKTFILEDLKELVKDLPETTHLPNIRSNDLAEIAFTSGTTGTPKGVLLTHGNLLSAVNVLTSIFPLKKEYVALSLLPLSHAFEQLIDLLSAYQVGIKIIYLERINKLTILKTLQKEGITSIALVPQVLQLLMNSIEAEVAEKGKQKVWSYLNSIAPYLPINIRRLLFYQVHQKLGGNLKFFGCGSAPLNIKLAQKWENLGIEVFEGYGATETIAAATINTSKDKKLGSVGKALPFIDIKIADQTSEILIKGPNVSPGYFEDEEKTKKAFINGWYHTGDVGKIDQDGFLYITGRESFRIVLPNGQKVYPEDIEKKLNAHPWVLESCVVGVKEELGEKVHAVIITKQPKKLDQIIKEVNTKLASHEQILEWSPWPEEDFPRTPILKIDRKKVALSVILRSDEATKDLKKEQIIQIDKLLHLISQITNLNPAKITDDKTLGTDLKLDSLARVELLSEIELEYGVALNETLITAQTKVGELRKFIEKSPVVEEQLPVNKSLYTPLISKIRTTLQNILVFPIHALFVPTDVQGQENLKDIPLPAIFYFNHVGVLDGVCALRVLPKQIREKLVIAVTSDVWLDYRKNWVQFLGGGFPFDKTERVKASLELTGEFLDAGYSILIAPEGTFSKNGKLLAFKPGAGYLATQLHVPVVPIKIDPGYLEIFPPLDSFWENLPKKRKKIWVKIGKPIYFSKDTPYAQAAKIMQQEIEKL